MTKSPLMTALAVALALTFALPACTFYQAKKERIENVIEEVGDPDERTIYYHQGKDGKVHFLNESCSGKFCGDQTLEPVMVPDVGP